MWHAGWKIRRGECVSRKRQSEAGTWRPGAEGEGLLFIYFLGAVGSGARIYGLRGRGRIRASLTRGQCYWVHNKKPDSS